jgi:hypothetical protein
MVFANLIPLIQDERKIDFISILKANYIESFADLCFKVIEKYISDEKYLSSCFMCLNPLLTLPIDLSPKFSLLDEIMETIVKNKSIIVKCDGLEVLTQLYQHFGILRNFKHPS